jgi:hypothetical protein
MALAGSGGKKGAYLANNRADLAASLGDIIVSSIPVPKCNCNAHLLRRGSGFSARRASPARWAWVVASAKVSTLATRPATGWCVRLPRPAGRRLLQAGVPSQEVCGIAPGCLAPTPADCADENCDGQIDEGLSCGCAYQPEVCNGLDDNCNGIVDDVPSIELWFQRGRVPARDHGLCGRRRGRKEDGVPGWRWDPSPKSATTKTTIAMA